MDPVIARFIDRLHDAFHDGDEGAAHKALEQANVAKLQEQYRAVVRGDLAGFAALLSDDIDMEFMGEGNLPFAGRWQGREAVVAAVKKNFSLLEAQQPEIEAVVAQGDTVVVLARETGRVKATGRCYEVRWIQWHQFREGLLCRFREMVDGDSLQRASRAE